MFYEEDHMKIFSHNLNAFKICSNRYLSRDVDGFYRENYLGFKNPDNPSYLNTLKNTFDGEKQYKLDQARNTVVNILCEDLPKVMKACGMQSCIVVSIPRAKRLESYSKRQLQLIEAVRQAALRVPGATDGTAVIRRHTDTKTTHFSSNVARTLADGTREYNTGRAPYVGITKDTCSIAKEQIKDRDVILVDDIYTWNVNIDEDAIQALLDNGAKRVVFYAVAKTGGAR